MKPPAPPEQRFWLKVNKDGPIHPELGQCWLWAGMVNPRRGVNHGRFILSYKLRDICSHDPKVHKSIPAQFIQAHRYSYILTYGGLPPEMLVTQACGESLCVNPAHLFAITKADHAREVFSR